MITRRTLLRAAPAGLAALAVARRAGAAAAAITIGAPANMSGGQAALDGRMINGAQLRVTEINKAGGVLGRPLALAVRDSRTDPPQAAVVARLLIEE
jgi:branched-chain amino acid transport system substrate-binding protein